MPIFLPALAALPGVGTAATGLVGVGGLAAAAPAISLSAIASWGILGGSFLYQTLNQPKGVDGPRLTNFSIRQSEYGLMKPLVWGSMRVNGNVIWPNQAALLITERKFSIEGGAVNKYQYYGTWAAAFGDGECAFIPKIWLITKSSSI